MAHIILPNPCKKRTLVLVLVVVVGLGNNNTGQCGLYKLFRCRAVLRCQSLFWLRGKCHVDCHFHPHPKLNEQNSCASPTAFPQRLAVLLTDLLLLDAQTSTSHPAPSSGDQSFKVTISFTPQLSQHSRVCVRCHHS